MSPFGVRASAGSLRGGVGVVLPHQWTEEGVVAEIPRALRTGTTVRSRP